MKKNGGMRGIGSVKWAKHIHLKGKIAGKTNKSHGKKKGNEGKWNNPGAEGAQGCASQEARPFVHHHGPHSPPRADRGGVYPWSSSFCFVASSFALPNPWYLLCYARVESLWAFLAIFFDPLGLENILIALQEPQWRRKEDAQPCH